MSTEVSLTAEQYSALPTYQKLDRLRQHLDITKQTVTQDLQTHQVMGGLLAPGNSMGTPSVSTVTMSLFQQLSKLQLFEPHEEPPVTEPSDPFTKVMEDEFAVILQQLENLKVEFEDVQQLDDLDKPDVTAAATTCFDSMLRLRNAARWRCKEIGSESITRLSEGTYNFDL